MAYFLKNSRDFTFLALIFVFFDNFLLKSGSIDMFQTIMYYKRKNQKID